MAITLKLKEEWYYHENPARKWMDDLTALLLHEMFIQPWKVTKMMSAGGKLLFLRQPPSSHSGFRKASETFGGKAETPNGHL